MAGEVSREVFTSRFAAFMVVIMTSLGVGNIWRFPYLCAKYGGAAFVIIYLIALIFLVNIGNQCEVCLGKFSRRGIVGAFTAVGRRPIWRFCGFVILWLNIIVMAYYNVVISWVLRYFATSFSGAVWQAASPEIYYQQFIDTPQVFLWTLLVNCIIFGVLWFGIVNGLEKVAKVMSPILFVVMAAMVVRTLTLPGVGVGLNYYLAPDWKYFFMYETWMQAIGQALWSGCFGWGILTALGSYMHKSDDIGSSITQTGLLDGGISWLVGLAIIPACFVYNVPIDSGSSLSFLVLPTIFKEMPLGHLSMVLFYASLAIAGICASIGCIEATLTPIIEEWGLSRKVVVPGAFVMYSLAAMPAALSKNAFDWIDLTIGTFAILLGGFFILIFVGWCWGAERVRKNVLNLGADIEFGSWWSFLVKYVAPGLLIFAAYGFFKVWLIPYVSAGLAWGIIVFIVVFNLVMIVSAVRHPVPLDIGDMPTEADQKSQLPREKALPGNTAT